MAMLDELLLTLAAHMRDALLAVLVLLVLVLMYLYMRAVFLRNLRIHERDALLLLNEKGVGVSANNAEYFDEPGLSLMLCALPSDQYRVFSGVAPLASSEMSGFEAHTALVHADPATPDLTELIGEMAGRTDTGYLFGGLSSGRGGALQFAVGGNGNIRGQGAAGGVFSGGLSGVVFGEGVRLVSRVTQGCQPLRSGSAREREITEADGNLVLQLDGEPALDVLLADLQVSLERPQEAIEAVRATLVGLVDAGSDGIRRTGDLGADVLVRHIIGLDPTRRGIAIADVAEAGMRLSFCRRNAQAARADLSCACSSAIVSRYDATEPTRRP